MLARSLSAAQSDGLLYSLLDIDMSWKLDGTESFFLPLAVDRFVQNGINDVFVHTAVAVNHGKSWQSKESEHLQIVGDSDNNI